MKNRIFFGCVILLMFIRQQGFSQNSIDHSLKDAKQAFCEEKYWQAMVFCNDNKVSFPAKNLERENLFTFSERCYSLSSKGCNTDALEEIIDIRRNYRLTDHPKTSKRIEECKKPVSQYTDHSVEKHYSADVGIEKTIRSNITMVFAEFKQAYRSGGQIVVQTSVATPVAINCMQTLWQKSSFYVIDEDIAKFETKINSGWQIRHLPVFFSNGDSGEITIEFDKNGIITNFKRVLPQRLFELKKVTEDGSYPLDDPEQLEIITNFLNQFSSAFWDKNIDFIDMVFDDFALIIQEKTTQIGYKTDEQGNKIPFRYDEKTKKDKNQYVSELRDFFQKNEWVNVDFYDVKIYRSKRDHNVYGINTLQLWQSPSDYTESGCGWVYLEIDFNNPQEPLIWIKTWQSYDTPESERYWVGSFTRVR